MSCPVPGISEASMKSTSPPASVQARPVATPGREVRNAVSGPELRGTEKDSTSRASTIAVWLESDATRAATFRAIVPI